MPRPRRSPIYEHPTPPHPPAPPRGPGQPTGPYVCAPETTTLGSCVPRPPPRDPPPDVPPVLPVLLAVLGLQRRLLIAPHEQHHREQHDAGVNQGPPASEQQRLPEDDRQHGQVHRV